MLRQFSCRVSRRAFSTQPILLSKTQILADEPWPSVHQTAFNLAAQNPSEYLSEKYRIPPPQRPQNESMETKRARLTWMSRKRGILETDLLLSTFAEKYLQTMSMAQLDEYDRLLEENDWDIYYWATSARETPEPYKSSEMMKLLVEHSKNKEKKILRMPSI